MRKTVTLLTAVSFIAMACCACQTSAEKLGVEETGQAHGDSTGAVVIKPNIDDEIQEYMSRYRSEYMSDTGMDIERRFLFGESTEGRDITRYRDSRGAVIRYRVSYYGEMAKAEENYYFINDYIYYTRLVENYSCPILYKTTEVMDREYEQGVLIDGVCCRYDGIEGVLMDSRRIEIPYGSQKELDDVFELAGEDGELETQDADYHTLSVNGYLLGGWYEGRWIEWMELYPMMPEEDSYTIYVDGQYQGTGKGRKEPEKEVELYGGPQVHFTEDEFESSGYNVVVAYSGAEILQIESGTVIPADNELYIDMLREYLLRNGLTDDFELTNIVKIDLDNDGQDEVFIQAYHQEDPVHMSMGIQYMRKVADGKVEEYMIPLTEPNVPADHLDITGFCDINGDGSKELLISAMGVGYHNYMVYEFKDNEFTRILENGGEH